MAGAEVVLVQGQREISLGRVDDADRCVLGLLDDLARLQLVLRRHGWSIRLRGASEDLRTLICDAGLDEVIPWQPP